MFPASKMESPKMKSAACFSGWWGWLWLLVGMRMQPQKTKTCIIWKLKLAIWNLLHFLYSVISLPYSITIYSNAMKILISIISNGQYTIFIQTLKDVTSVSTIWTSCYIVRKLGQQVGYQDHAMMTLAPRVAASMMFFLKKF